jgi:hypothetical protein
LAGETVTVNAKARLTINSDPQVNRVLMGDINIVEGECFVDGTTVREISFTTASVLPVLGDTLTVGSVSGQVIGVAGTIAAGSVRLRSLNGVIANGASLVFTGGKTATSSSVDRIGWLRILGAEVKRFITTRLSKLTIQGEWYELAVATGTASQVIQHYTTDAVPAIWVETGSGTGIYEIWLNGGDRFPASIGDGLRGKFFGNANGNANITFGNGTLGAIPPTGARIRVPNITIGSSLTTAPTAGTINATLASRYGLNTASSGEVSISKCSGAGFYVNANQAFSINAIDSGFFHQIAASEIASDCILRRVGVGLLGVAVFQSSVFSVLKSLVLEDCVMASYSGTINSSNILVQDSSNISITRGYYCFFARGDARQNTLYLLRCSTFNISGAILCGGSADIITSKNGVLTNIIFSDTTIGLNITTAATQSIQIASGSSNITVNGLQQLNGGTLPRNALVVLNTADNIKIRNIGTALAPLNMASQVIFIVQILGVVENIEIARCYAINTVTSAKSDTNTVSRLTMLNVWSDTADTVTNNSLNARYSGLRGGNGVHGATGIASALQAVYGTHFYDTFFSTTTGCIGLHMLEKSSIEPSASTYTIDSGTPVFNSNGSLLLRTVGDQITWTCPWFVLGHTGFQNAAPVLASAVNSSNYLITYRIDTGLGFSGAFKAATGVNLSAEVINSTTGFRMQIRITATTSNSTNSLQGLFFPTITNATGQQTLYPLDLVSSSLTLSGLIAGSEVRIFRISDNVEVGGIESSGTSFTYSYNHFGSDIPVRFVVLNPGFIAIDVAINLTTQPANIPIQQRGDYSYA